MCVYRLSYLYNRESPYREDATDRENEVSFFSQEQEQRWRGSSRHLPCDIFRALKSPGRRVFYTFAYLHGPLVRAELSRAAFGGGRGVRHSRAQQLPRTKTRSTTHAEDAVADRGLWKVASVSVIECCVEANGANTIHTRLAVRRDLRLCARSRMRRAILLGDAQRHPNSSRIPADGGSRVSKPSLHTYVSVL